MKLGRWNPKSGAPESGFLCAAQSPGLCWILGCSGSPTLPPTEQPSPDGSECSPEPCPHCDPSPATTPLRPCAHLIWCTLHPRIQEEVQRSLCTPRTRQLRELSAGRLRAAPQGPWCQCGSEQGWEALRQCDLNTGLCDLQGRPRGAVLASVAVAPGAREESWCDCSHGELLPLSPSPALPSSVFSLLRFDERPTFTLTTAGPRVHAAGPPCLLGQAPRAQVGSASPRGCPSPSLLPSLPRTRLITCPVQ